MRIALSFTRYVNIVFSAEGGPWIPVTEATALDLCTGQGELYGVKREVDESEIAIATRPRGFGVAPGYTDY